MRAVERDPGPHVRAGRRVQERGLLQQKVQETHQLRVQVSEVLDL